MGFASIDAMVKALTGGRKQEWSFVKDGGATNETPEAAGNWVSYYLATGSPGAATAPTTSWASFDNGAGSMVFTDVASNKRYLYGVEACATVAGTLLIYDRLGHRQTASNALASTGDKTIGASLPSRYSGADAEDLHNIEAWIELTVATNTTAPIISMNSYTNSAGTSSRAGGSLTFPATATNVGWASPLPLQAGDKGVQAISTINVATGAASTGTANVFLMRPIARIPIPVANIATVITVRDGLVPRRIYDDSSLCFLYFATSTTVVDFHGTITTVYDGG